MQSRWLTDWFSWAKAAHAPKTTDSCFPKELSLWSYLELLPETRSCLTIFKGAALLDRERISCGFCAGASLPHLKFSTLGGPVEFLHLVIWKEMRLRSDCCFTTFADWNPVQQPRIHVCGINVADDQRIPDQWPHA